MITVYGHERCRMVKPVLALLDSHYMDYEYVDILADDDAKAKVMEINNGFMSVPTIVFSDGETMTEPTLQYLNHQLETRWDKAFDDLTQTIQEMKSNLYTRDSELVATQSPATTVDDEDDNQRESLRSIYFDRKVGVSRVGSNESGFFGNKIPDTDTKEMFLERFKLGSEIKEILEPVSDQLDEIADVDVNDEDG